MNNIEFDLVTKKNIDGIPDPGKAHCSNFRSGHCQVKFFELSPWSDYSVLYTDYTTHTTVQGCDTFLGGMIKLDWSWALTRTPLEKGTADHTTMTSTVKAVFADKRPDIDFDDYFYST